ncbi:MAG: L-seryl-tRNA(Sec) selenium transferase, partial [Acidobacteriota bacterium]
RNPLFRALRVDKLTLAALEATIACYAAGRGATEIPAQVALRLTYAEINRRARRFKQRAAQQIAPAMLTLLDGFSVVGGGAAPEGKLPTTLMQVEIDGLTAVELEQRLRECTPPVISRILDDRLVLDLRTVTEAEEGDVLHALKTCSKV